MASKKSKASKQSKAQERQERLRELQQQQKSAERRRNILIFGTTAVVALAIIGGTAWGIMQQDDGDGGGSAGRLEAASDDLGINGLRVAEVNDSTHVAGDVDYPESPPVGGDHWDVWQNCGFYDEPVEDENAVHSLEHGAVWITYSPDLPDDQVEELRSLTTPGNFVLVSPRDDIGSPVVASAWGYQVKLDNATDSRLQPFLDRFVQGEQTPEPGASCDSGTGEPEFGE